MEKAFVFNRGQSGKSRAGSALSRKSAGIGGYGQKSNRTKESSIIQQNILAVKNHNYNFANSSHAGDMTRADPDLSDTMVPGPKFGHDSVSDSNIGTNYTKTHQYALAESQDVSQYDKKAKKQKRLPKIYDDSRVTPK